MYNIAKTYSDTELLSELAAGSDAAFTILYNKYWEKIYIVSDFYLKDKSMVEDVVQEVFLIIWKKRSDLPAIVHLQQYLQTIARNLIISALRRNILTQKFEREHAVLVAETNWKPLLEIEYKEATELIAKAVNQLSPRQKEIYLMNKDKELSLKDTAVQLNISYDTARQYKSEALKKIRVFLKKNIFRINIGLLVFISF